MQRFWSRLAVELGKRAGLVAVVGLLVTLILGFGITQLVGRNADSVFVYNGTHLVSLARGNGALQWVFNLSAAPSAPPSAESRARVAALPPAWVASRASVSGSTSGSRGPGETTGPTSARTALMRAEPLRRACIRER